METLDGSHIRNNLPGRPMRMAMETKALLATKGDIYVGTGNSESVTITELTTAGTTQSQTYNIPVTGAINVFGDLYNKTENGTYTLQCTITNVSTNPTYTFSWVAVSSS